MTIENALTMCRDTGLTGLVNAHRKNQYDKVRQKQQYRWNPEYCTCKKKTCERYKKCDECKEYHYSKNSLPYCER